MNNADLIYKILREEYNLNNASICGILSNIYYESNFNPEVFGDGGTSYGLCQWHNERFTLLKNTYPDDYNTISSQINFLFMELKGGYKTLYNKIIKANDTVSDAYNIASLFCLKYEIPADKEEKANTRGEYAKKLFVSISPKTYTNNELADLVIKGSFGNGIERQEKLESMGYNYQEIQSLVNEKLKVTTNNNVEVKINKQNYLIQRGDTLTKISNKFGVSIDSIIKNNKGKYPRITPDYIQAGWIITIIK